MDSKAWNSEGVDLTLEELGTLNEALNEVLPGILHAMIAGGLIDPKRVSDREYLWSVVKKNLAEQLENVGIIFELDKEFLAAAKAAILSSQPAAAVVLLSTVIEHKLNTYHRLVLESKGLSNRDVTEIISRNSFADKLGWLMSLAGTANLPQQLTTRINTLIELRDCIVHYKARPSSSLDTDESSWHGLHGIRGRLNQLDLRGYITLIEEMDQLLEARLEEQDPYWRLAKETCIVMLGPQLSQSANQT